MKHTAFPLLQSLAAPVVFVLTFVVTFTASILFVLPLALIGALLGAGSGVSRSMTPGRDGKDHGELFTDGRSNLFPER